MRKVNSTHGHEVMRMCIRGIVCVEVADQIRGNETTSADLMICDVHVDRSGVSDFPADCKDIPVYVDISLARVDSRFAMGSWLYR